VELLTLGGYHAQVESVAESQIALDCGPQVTDGGDDQLPAPPGWRTEVDHLSGTTFYVHDTSGEIQFDRPAPEGWSREVAILGSNFTPNNIHETARLRVALAESSAVAAELQRLEEVRRQQLDPDEVQVAEVRMQVIDALDRGGTMRCPRCGVRVTTPAFSHSAPPSYGNWTNSGVSMTLKPCGLTENCPLREQLEIAVTMYSCRSR
jgi:hypothetical protein